MAWATTKPRNRNQKRPMEKFFSCSGKIRSKGIVIAVMRWPSPIYQNYIKIFLGDGQYQNVKLLQLELSVKASK